MAIVVGVAQMRSTDDRRENYAAVRKIVLEAKSRGVQFCCFPEGFHFIGGGSSGLQSKDIAEEIMANDKRKRGEFIQCYFDLAREQEIVLSLGGFQEVASKSKVSNSHLIIGSDGSLLGVYRKMHLFDYADGGLMESSFTERGTQPVSVNLNEPWVLGLTTCYDLRFPSLYQYLRAEMGCNIMLVPSAFTRRTGEAHWHCLLRARAIETQSYVLAAAQVGKHNTNNRESYGHAMIIDPWGRVIAEGPGCDDTRDDIQNSGTSSCSSGQLLVAKLDPGLLSQVRASMPISQHKRFAVVQNSDAFEGALHDNSKADSSKNETET